MNTKILIALMVVLIVGVFFLLSPYRTYISGILPFLFILSCPLSHFFMHSEHGHHHEEKKSDSLLKHNHEK